MDETDVCVLDRDDVLVCESKTASTAKAIVVALAKAPSCRRIVFETGEWADPVSRLEPTRSPVVCLESRQAYHALKSLATHKDRPRKRSRARPEAAPPWSPTLGHRPRGLGGSVSCSFVLGVAAVTIETAYCEQETRH